MHQWIQTKCIKQNEKDELTSLFRFHSTKSTHNRHLQFVEKTIRKHVWVGKRRMHTGGAGGVGGVVVVVVVVVVIVVVVAVVVVVVAVAVVAVVIAV